MLNWSDKKYEKNPTLVAATFLILVYGDIKIKPPILWILARNVAGPEPSDLPRAIMSYALRLEYERTN